MVYDDPVNVSMAAKEVPHCCMLSQIPTAPVSPNQFNACFLHCCYLGRGAPASLLRDPPSLLILVIATDVIEMVDHY